MSHPLISIIVPVYNVEKYLRRCLDSILAQTFTDWECILVDDGSTDGSGTICDEYAEKDSRFQIFHKENGGVSSARNVGIKTSRAKWITFVDSDDWLQNKFLEHLKSEANDKTDLVAMGFQKFGNSTETMQPSHTKKIRCLKELPRLWDVPLPEFVYCFPWAKLFNKNILENYGISFDTTLFYSEDYCFVMDFTTHCGGITEIPYTDYQYFQPVRDSKYHMNCNQFVRHMAAHRECFDKISQCTGRHFVIQEANAYQRIYQKFFLFLSEIHSFRQFKDECRQFLCISWIDEVQLKIKYRGLYKYPLFFYAFLRLRRIKKMIKNHIKNLRYD